MKTFINFCALIFLFILINASFADTNYYVSEGDDLVEFVNPINDCTEQNRCIINVASGEYDLSTGLTIKSYMHLISTGGPLETTINCGLSEGAYLGPQANSKISGFKLTATIDRIMLFQGDDENPANNVEISNNIFINLSEFSGDDCGDQDPNACVTAITLHNHSFSDTLIHNNLFIGFTGAAIDVGGNNSPAITANIFNNIFYENDSVINNGTESDLLSITYNDFYNNSRIYQYDDEDVTVVGRSGNIEADPLFADAENGDYSLTLDSPCIEAGILNGGVVDIGPIDYPSPNETNYNAKTSTNYYWTIQGAINDSESGSQITLANRTIYQTATMGSDLTVTGEGSDSTVNCGGSGTGFSINNISNATISNLKIKNCANGILITNNSNNITIQDVTIEDYGVGANASFYTDAISFTYNGTTPYTAVPDEEEPGFMIIECTECELMSAITTDVELENTDGSTNFYLCLISASCDGETISSSIFITDNFSEIFPKNNDGCTSISEALFESEEEEKRGGAENCEGHNGIYGGEVFTANGSTSDFTWDESVLTDLITYDQTPSIRYAAESTYGIFIENSGETSNINLIHNIISGSGDSDINANLSYVAGRCNAYTTSEIVGGSVVNLTSCAETCDDEIDNDYDLLVDYCDTDDCECEIGYKLNSVTCTCTKIAVPPSKGDPVTPDPEDPGSIPIPEPKTEEDDEDLDNDLLGGCNIYPTINNNGSGSLIILMLVALIGLAALRRKVQ